MSLSSKGVRQCQKDSAMIINKKLLLALCATVIVACHNSDSLLILDSDGDRIVEFASDTLGGAVSYCFKDRREIAFEYIDNVMFSKDETIEAFFSRQADILFGENRTEFGLNVVLSILFDSDLSMLEIRMISRNLTLEQTDQIRKLVKESEGKWSFVSNVSKSQPYYLKIVRIQFY